MRDIRYWIFLGIGSLAYWAAIAFLITFFALAIPGDCGVEKDVAAIDTCFRTVRLTVIVSLGVAAIMYGLGLRRVLTRSNS